MSYNGEATTRLTIMTLKSNWIYFFIGGFGGGILFRSFFYFGSAFTTFAAVVALSVAAVYFSRRTPLILLGAIVLIGFSIGLVRFDHAETRLGSVLLEEYVGKSISAEGIIVDEPDERETNTHLTILLHEVEGESVKVKVLAFPEL